MNNAENTRALMLHIMQLKQQQKHLGDSIARSSLRKTAWTDTSLPPKRRRISSILALQS